MKSSIITITITAISALTANAGMQHPSQGENIQLDQVKPVHTTPILARESEEGKTILLSVTINADGSVAKVTAVDSRCCDELLAARVVRSVGNWKFEPALDQNQQPVPATVLLPVNIASVERS